MSMPRERISFTSTLNDSGMPASIRGTAGEPTVEPGLPESFNVLVRELQSLCLDVELLSDRPDAQGASMI